MEEESNMTPNCPPPSVYEKTEKILEKNYNIKYKEKKYDLIITIYENKNNDLEKIFNFKLLYPIDNINKYYSYENEKSTGELTQLFLINILDNKDKEKKILEKIEKFHLNNNVELIINKNTDIIDLVYKLKTYDDEDIKFTIELSKKGNIESKEMDKYELIKEIQSLKNTIKNMEQKYDNIIKGLNEKINMLTDKIDNLSLNNNIKNIKENNQLIFKSDLSLLNSLKMVNVDIDGSRGLNDYFEPFYIKDDQKTVYIAVKCKEKDSYISFIDIYKMTSFDNIKKIKTLKGYQRRIVFVKYFKNPYTLQEYLISGDREEKVRTWEILDEKNYKLLNVITTNYGRTLMQQSIYNCLIYFTNNNSYIYTTTVTNNCSRVYDLYTGAFVKDISITLYYYTLFLIRYKGYIIDCCKNFIIIYNPFNEEIYAKIENSYTKGDNRSACIIYNENDIDYLCISNSNGYIIIYNLKEKDIYYVFELYKDLYHIILWDLEHLIVAQYDSDSLAIININNKKIDNFIKCPKTMMCIKKINLNNSDEILLASGENSGDIFMFYSLSNSKSSKYETAS